MAVASTTTRRRWASERLGMGMGDDSRVMPAIGRLKRKGRSELARLEQVYENHNGAMPLTEIQPHLLTRIQPLANAVTVN